MTTTASLSPEISQYGSVPLNVRVTPALLGLIYPALVWSVHAVSPFALVLTLLAPAACLYAASVLSRGNRFVWATRVAYFGVGAPALYTFLGGWLDLQKWLPFGADGGGADINMTPRRSRHFWARWLAPITS